MRRKRSLWDRPAWWDFSSVWQTDEEAFAINAKVWLLLAGPVLLLVGLAALWGFIA